MKKEKKTDNKATAGKKAARSSSNAATRSSSNAATRSSSKGASETQQKPPSKSPPKSSKKLRTSVFSKILLLIVCMLLVVFIAASKLGNVAFSNVTDSFKSFLSAFNPGEGYPYKTQAMNIDTVDMIGSDIFILGKDTIKVLSSSAKEIQSVQHSYSNAEAEISNGRAIVFDRASGRFKVLSRSKVLLEKDMNQNILVAAIGEKGNVAVATKSPTAQSKLTVFDKNSNTVFAWECATERISSVALSNNGETAAVSVVGAKNAELYSKLFIFEFDKSKTVASFEYPGTALVRVKFGKNGTVLAVGDNLFSVIDEKNKQKEDVPFGTSKLHRLYIYESGKMAIVLSSFGNLADNKLKVFGNDGKLMFEKSIAEEVNWVACDKNYTSVLLNKKVQSFNNKGDQMGDTKVLPDADKVMINGKNIYVLTNEEINRYSTIGTIQ